MTQNDSAYKYEVPQRTISKPRLGGKLMKTYRVEAQSDAQVLQQLDQVIGVISPCNKTTAPNGKIHKLLTLDEACVYLTNTNGMRGIKGKRTKESWKFFW
jgi:hypothetical protein